MPTANHLTLLITALEMGLLLWAGYLFVLTIAGLSMPRRTLLFPHPRHRFAILIPAHNAASLLPGLLDSLAAQRYPRELYDVYLVADRCRDYTARIARRGGAIVYEYAGEETDADSDAALRWLLSRVQEAPKAYDAFILLRPRDRVSANFLQVMDARLGRGETVIQARRYRPPRTPKSASPLRRAAQALEEIIWPLGQEVLGGATSLQREGFCLAAYLLRLMGWDRKPTTLPAGEVALFLAGERITFAPDAVVTLHPADSAPGMAELPQRERWPSLALLQAGLRQRTRRSGDRHSLLRLFLTRLTPPMLPFCGLIFLVLGLHAALLLSSPQVRTSTSLGLAGLLLAGVLGILMTGRLVSRSLEGEGVANPSSLPICLPQRRS